MVGSSVRENATVASILKIVQRYEEKPQETLIFIASLSAKIRISNVSKAKNLLQLYRTMFNQKF
jgi:archaellum biogenesis ATPase FlaH